MRFLPFVGSKIRKSRRLQTVILPSTATPQLSTPRVSLVAGGEKFRFSIQNWDSYDPARTVRFSTIHTAEIDMNTGVITVTPISSGTVSVQVFVSEPSKAESTGSTMNSVTCVTPDFESVGLQAWHSSYITNAVRQATVLSQNVATRFKDLSGNGYDFIQPSFEYAPLVTGSGASRGLNFEARRMRQLTQNTTNINLTTGVITTTAGGPMFTSGEAGESVFVSSSTTLPTGLSASTVYYIGNISGNTLTLHTSRENALAGTSPVIPTAAGSGGLTIAMEVRSRFMRTLGSMYNAAGLFNTGVVLAGFLQNVTHYSYFFLVTANPFSLATGSLNRVLEGVSRNANEQVGTTAGLSTLRAVMGINQGNALRSWNMINDSSLNTYSGTNSALTAGVRTVLEYEFVLTSTSEQFKAYINGSAHAFSAGVTALNGTTAGALANSAPRVRFMGNGENPSGTNALPAAATIHEEIVIARTGGVTPAQRTSIVNALLSRTA